MARWAFRCPACRSDLGTFTRKTDHRGRPYLRLTLNHHVEQVGRALFQGRYAECRCGERVPIPHEARVEFR